MGIGVRCSGKRVRCSGKYPWRYINRSIVRHTDVLFLNYINIKNYINCANFWYNYSQFSLECPGGSDRDIPVIYCCLPSWCPAYRPGCRPGVLPAVANIFLIFAI